MKVEEKLKSLGIELAELPVCDHPIERTKRSGNLLFVSGHGSKKTHGKVGADLSVDQGYEAAKEACIHCLDTDTPVHRPEKTAGYSYSLTSACHPVNNSRGKRTTNHDSKIFGKKKSRNFPKAKLEFAALQQLFTKHLHCIQYCK